MVKKFDIFYGVSIITLVILAVTFIIYMKNRRGESFDTEIDQDKAKFDDALEKRIAEVKEEHPRFDAELLLDVNRPYQADKPDQKGWWGDVIHCRKNGDLEIYCKPTEKWIWPY